jgi:ABC-type transport system substrate-binding protein
VKFHDGTPCDGKALITNFNAAFSSPIAVALRPLVKGAEQTGELSMTIEMQHPWVTFPATYAAQQVAFVASPSMAKLPNSGGAHPIGTGPFVFKEWAVDSHITLTANPHYWRPGLPYLDEVTFRPIPDDDARSQALASGAVDMIITTSPQTIARLSGDRRFSFVDNRGRMVGSPNLGCLMLNCSKPPFDDPLARRILATGISAEAYSKVINQGIIPPARGLFQPGSPYYSTTSYPTYDKKKARSLAAEYRSKHGKALEFTSLGTATPQSIRQGEYMQQVLKDVGVTLHTQHISQNEVISAALSGTYQAMGWLSFGGISPDLDYVWFSPTTIDPHGISLNMAHNDDPQIERAMVAGMGARSRRDQIAAFRKVNERLAVDLPYIWINRSVWAIASSTHAQNWNNPRSPEGHRLLGNDQGLFWLTQAWRS